MMTGLLSMKPLELKHFCIDPIYAATALTKMPSKGSLATIGPDRVGLPARLMSYLTVRRCSLVSLIYTQ